MSEVPRLSPAARAAIQSDARLEVLLLLEQASWTAAELAQALGRSRQAIVHHIAELTRAGLVEEVGREPISGGPLISYGATHAGWAEAVRALNSVVEPTARPD